MGCVLNDVFLFNSSTLKWTFCMKLRQGWDKSRSQKADQNSFHLPEDLCWFRTFITLVAFIAQAACVLEKIGDLSFFQQQDTIVSHTFTYRDNCTHASTILCTILCTGKKEGKETPEAQGKSYRAAEGKKRRQACSFREDNQRGTSTHRVGLFFHMNLVMIWYKTLYPSNKQGFLWGYLMCTWDGQNAPCTVGDFHNI